MTTSRDPESPRSWPPIHRVSKK